MTIVVESPTDSPEEVETVVAEALKERDQDQTPKASTDDGKTPEGESKPKEEPPKGEAPKAATPKDGEADPGQAEGEEPPSGSVQKRIQRALKDKHSAINEKNDAVARAEALEEQLTALRDGKAHTPETEPKKADEKPPEAKPQPKLEDFDNYEEWLRADRQWDWDQKVTTLRAEIKAEIEAKADEVKEESTAVTETKKANEVLDGYNERLDAARLVHEDFDTVLDGTENVPLNDATKECIILRDQGAEVLYYLATHLEEAESIEQMNSAQTYMAIGKIEAQLGVAEPKGKEEPKPKGEEPKPKVAEPKAVKAAISKAPEPLETVEGAVTVSEMADDDPNLPMQEYIRRREAHESKVGRR